MDNLELLKEIKSIIDPLKDDVNTMKDDMNTMKDDVNAMKDDMNTMKDDIKDIKNRLDNVEAGLEDVNHDVRRVNMIIENEVNRNIGLLVDGHKGLRTRLWHLPEEVEEIKESVSILKFVQQQMAKKSGST
jgi:chromosome segregation ATPase